jgi:hypothetical protein
MVFVLCSRASTAPAPAPAAQRSAAPSSPHAALNVEFIEKTDETVVPDVGPRRQQRYTYRRDPDEQGQDIISVQESKEALV